MMTESMLFKRGGRTGGYEGEEEGTYGGGFRTVAGKGKYSAAYRRRQAKRKAKKSSAAARRRRRNR